MRSSSPAGPGFVGPRVVHAIRAEGHDVRALVRDPGSKGAKTLAAGASSSPQGDMTDDGEPARGPSRACDAVVHLVAILAASRARRSSGS